MKLQLLLACLSQIPSPAELELVAAVCAQTPKDSKDAVISSCPLQGMGEPTLAAAGR